MNTVFLTTILWIYQLALPEAGNSPLAENADDAIAKARQLQQQMQTLQVSAMEPNQSGKSDFLQEMIKRIEAFQLSSDAQTSRKNASPAAAGMPKSENVQKPVKNQEAAAAKEPLKLSVDVLDSVKSPIDPMGTADALYQIGDYSRAMRFYQSISDDKTRFSEIHQQWALYQIANCQSRMDITKAPQFYQQLITAFPNSQWSPGALAQKKKCEWLIQNENKLKAFQISNDPNYR